MIDSKTYSLALAATFLLAAGLRFWNLGDINQPVFDEVFFPKYAYDYLTSQEFFDTHPPLSKYIIGAGIWLYHHMPWIDAPVIGSVPFEQLDAYSYRWLNALTGSLLVLVIGAAAHALSGKQLFSIMAALLVAIDGSLLVDSRYGLNNIYLVLFGFLALLYVGKIVFSPTERRRNMLYAGVFLGLSFSIKWNGLGYWLTITALLVMHAIMNMYDKYRSALVLQGNTNPVEAVTGKQIKIQLREIICFLVAVPVLIYSLLWIPDNYVNTRYSFVEMHQQMFGYHADTVKENEHPYCAKWYTWPAMSRPLGYYFSESLSVNDAGESVRIFRDVHSFPNPAIYWLAAFAICVMVIHWIILFWRWLREGTASRQWFLFTIILLGYFSNLLPWAFVSRCLFIYHYQSASVFAFLALAWYLAQGCSSKSRRVRAVTLLPIALIIAAGIYWLPFQLGIPLEAQAFYQRMWFQSWI